MAVPVLVVLLVCGAAGVGIFGMTAFDAAGVLRAEVGTLQTQVGTLSATVATLQTENANYKNVLTRVHAATGSRQASLAELNEWAGSAVPTGAAP